MQLPMYYICRYNTLTLGCQPLTMTKEEFENKKIEILLIVEN